LAKGDRVRESNSKKSLSKSRDNKMNFFGRKCNQHDVCVALLRARAMIPDGHVRMVSLGAEDGYILSLSHDLFKDQADYIGMEGGSLVGADPTYLEKAESLATDTGMIMHGMDAEHVFSRAKEERHPVVSFNSSLPTLGHIYDGGVLQKHEMTCVYDIADTFAPLSVMVFVTSAEAAWDKTQADVKHIKEGMTSRSWHLRSTMPIQEKYSLGDEKFIASHPHLRPEPTMVALFFGKEC
jgi:hypothetical protein